MRVYKIATASSIGGPTLEVVIRGPGIASNGLRRRFVSLDEADDFVDAMNMAFDQGRTKVGEIEEGIRSEGQPARSLLRPNFSCPGAVAHLEC